jgi:hypothetical protein
MRMRRTPNHALDGKGDLVLPIACRRIPMPDEENPLATHHTLRRVVRAYARDPSERNALMVEATIQALRRQRTGSRS